MCEGIDGSGFASRLTILAPPLAPLPPSGPLMLLPHRVLVLCAHGCRIVGLLNGRLGCKVEKINTINRVFLFAKMKQPKNSNYNCEK